MTLDEALKWAQSHLNETGIATSRLDALVLLEDCSGIDRAKILTEPATELSEEIVTKYQHKVKLRCKQIPLAYIRGKTEFYGREFLIDERVLEPRPESETLIEELLRLIDENKRTTVIDIGTGSGALIITAKLECPSIDAYGIDISKPSLELAAINAAKYDCPIGLIKSDLIKNVPHRLLNAKTILIANLPYVPDNWQINGPAMKEPAIAIFGGRDGLRLYVSLFNQLKLLNEPPGKIITEAMPPQHDQLQTIASKAGYLESARNDFIQVFSHS